VSGVLARSGQTNAQVSTSDPGERCVACNGPLIVEGHCGAVQLFRCPLCGTRTALPRPTTDDVVALHNAPSYLDKTYFEARRGRERVTLWRFERLLSLLGTEAPGFELRGQRMLDVGCDTGDFLLTARDVAGVDPFGVDVAKTPLETAAARGITAHRGELRDAPGEFHEFALITAIDLIEHVADPRGLLRAAESRLAGDGFIYLETPNWPSAVYRLGRVAGRVTGNRPDAVFDRLFPAEHVQYFTAVGLRQLAARSGLRIVRVFAQPLRAQALAGGPALKLAMSTIQLPDRVTGTGILLSALLTRATT
jgi:2-polyprenyl-3-methyl-5-hydroxy-6-metoxy-1,4-benzoquinol methylase